MPWGNNANLLKTMHALGEADRQKNEAAMPALKPLTLIRKIADLQDVITGDGLIWTVAKRLNYVPGRGMVSTVIEDEWKQNWGPVPQWVRYYVLGADTAMRYPHVSVHFDTMREIRSLHYSVDSGDSVWHYPGAIQIYARSDFMAHRETVRNEAIERFRSFLRSSLISGTKSLPLAIEGQELEGLAALGL